VTSQTHETPAWVLLVEDDLNQLVALSLALEQAGFLVKGVSNLDEARQEISQSYIDILVSDIILGADFDAGFSLATWVRQNYPQLPIIFLSDRRNPDDIWQGHQLGALDYLAKPIHPPLLVQKLHNLVRITQGRSQSKVTGLVLSKVDPYLEIDALQACAYWKKTPIDLTLTEFEMLVEMASQPANSLIDYDSLTKATQGVVERNTINTHICRIRQAFRKHDQHFDAIQNVYGRGYRWCV